MVGGQQHHVVVRDRGVHHLAHQLVDALDRLGHGRVDTRVAHHVAVGEVEDDEVLDLGIDLVDQLLGHLGGAHLRQQVVGRHLRGVHQDAVFVLELQLAAAVEEEGHVGVLLRLGDAQLALAGLGDGLAEGIVHQLLVEEDMHAGEGGIVRGEAAVVQREGVHPLFRHVLLRQHGRQLAGAVVAEVVEDDGVALLDLGEGLAVLGDHDRLDELVGHVGVVGCLDAVDGALERGALAFDQQVVGLLDAVPALVAVHRVETAAHGSDLARGLGHLLLELLEEALAAVRVGVAAVHEGMDIDLLQAVFLRYAQELIDMVQGGVHAAVGGQAHQVELLAGGLDVVVDRLDLGVVEELVLAHGHVDLDEVLVDHAAGAEVHVSDLGVAHLSVGQADVLAAGLQVAVRILGAQAVDDRRALRPDGVGIIMSALAPTVEDHQKYFAVHILCHLLSSLQR